MAYNKKDHNAEKSATIDNKSDITKKDSTSEKVSFSDSENVYNQIQQTLADGSYRKKDKAIFAQEELIEDEEVVKVSNIEESASKEKSKNKKTKNKKEKKPHEKTTLMHKMKVFGVLLVLGVFTGSGLGVWYFNVNLRSNVNYSDYKVEEYLPNVSEVFSRNFGVTNINDKNWINNAGGKTPSDLTPLDNILVAVQNATLADSFIFLGNGSAVSLGITQTVYSQRRYNGSAYTFESMSLGTITVANCDYYRKGGSEVAIYTGKNITKKNLDDKWWTYSATWSESEKMTATAYKDKTGSLPSGITPYIFSDKTILSSSIEHDSEHSQWKLTFDLNPVTSALLYYKEVKRTGGLEGDPEFYKINFTAIIDENWNLIETSVKESYKAIKFGLGVGCDGEITIKYSFNIDVEMYDFVEG